MDSELPEVGDSVRLRGCGVSVRGVIVDEFGTDYVRVQWDDVAAPTTHRRRNLEVTPRLAG